MKVKYIKENRYSLVKDKIYNAFMIKGRFPGKENIISVIDDFGEEYAYPKDWFEIVEITPEEERTAWFDAMAELDDAADKAGGYVVLSSEIERDEEFVRNFSTFRRYCVAHNIKDTKNLTQKDYTAMGLPKSFAIPLDIGHRLDDPHNISIGKEEDILKYLPTPCGAIRVVDETNNAVPFAVTKSGFNCDYEIEYSNGDTKLVDTDTNFHLIIKSESLKKNAEYKIYLDGTQLHYGDGDEDTECVSGCSNGYCIALGSLIQNGIAIEMLDDYSGFSYRIVDDILPYYVSFSVAWIKSEESYEDEYEAAVQFWTT